MWALLGTQGAPSGLGNAALTDRGETYSQAWVGALGGCFSRDGDCGQQGVEYCFSPLSIPTGFLLP